MTTRAASHDRLLRATKLGKVLDWGDHNPSHDATKNKLTRTYTSAYTSPYSGNWLWTSSALELASAGFGFYEPGHRFGGARVADDSGWVRAEDQGGVGTDGTLYSCDYREEGRHTSMSVSGTELGQEVRVDDYALVNWMDRLRRAVVAGQK